MVIILIDVASVFVRQAYASPDNMLERFFNKIAYLAWKFNTDRFVFLLDKKLPGIYNFRKVIYPSYKSKRKPLDDYIVDGFTQMDKVFTKFRICTDFCPKAEADDMIGSYARQFALDDSIDKIIIVSSDKDLMQLVDDEKSIIMYSPFKNRIIQEKEVIEKLGVPPEKVPLYLALVGDPADNYPGKPGCGPVTANKLINRMNKTEKDYINDDHMQLMLRLSRCKTDIPIRHKKVVPIDYGEVIEYIKASS